MENIEVNKFSFTYPGKTACAVDNISFRIEPGEYAVVVGNSGSGKTTLLKNLKPAIAPHGKKQGEIIIGNREIDTLSLREQTEKIGFVMQNPDNQIVTDKVWHELSFGLENLGIPDSAIRSRTSEMAEYFGISNWFYKDVNTLSGGQKQMLNLAAVMAMRPEILILDEPVSQLDPVAASDFLSTVSRINRELGTTVIITEHRLEDIFPCADKIILLDKGRIVCVSSPDEIGKNKEELELMKYSLPAAMKIYTETGNNDFPCPVTVRDGRQWLYSMFPNVQCKSVERKEVTKNSSVAELKNVSFKYEKKGEIVLDNLSCSFQKGKLTAVMGGNGNGKSTLLKILGGIYKPLEGKVKISVKKIAYLPQQPELVFTRKTVKEELQTVSEDIDETVKLTDIAHVLDSHPFDLSGGEIQRAALAKVLLTEPDVVLLDEPTKGMDGEFKEKLAKIFLSLTSRGCTVIIVSHDIEFCGAYADECMMLFGGKIVYSDRSCDFFSNNMFYTTAAHRMTAGIFDNAVTNREASYLCKKNLKL